MRLRAILMAAGLPVLAAPPAAANFPGRNGPIAYWSKGNDLRLIDRSGRQTLVAGSAHLYTSRPQFSPDGRWIAYSANRLERGYKIYLIRTDGSRKHTIAKNALDPSFSPSGKRILFARRGGIYVMRRDGSHVHCLERPVRPNVGNGQPIFFPNGRRIVFVRTGLLDEHIKIMNHKGEHVRSLTPKGGATYPDVSPDGRWVAYEHEGAPWGIYLIHPDGSGRHLILRGRCKAGLTDSSPTFSPNGRRILFTRDNVSRSSACRPNYVFRLTTMSLDGRHPRFLGPDHVLQSGWGSLP